jgi:CheY-like chemotaxis protein
MRKKILIIDDQPGFTKLVKIVLEGTKAYEVRELNNPAMALQAAHEYGPDVVLLDLNMPGLDGGDVSAKLRKDPALKNIPIMFLTGSVLQQEVALNKGRIGGEFYIAKPISMENLVRCIEDNIEAAGQPELPIRQVA